MVLFHGCHIKVNRPIQAEVDFVLVYPTAKECGSVVGCDQGGGGGGGDIWSLLDV